MSQQNPLVRALKLCDESKHPRWTLGAVVTRGGATLATGVSKFANHPLVLGGGKGGSSVHAEADALSRCDARGATIYVARKRANDRKIALARPCGDCMSMLVEAGVKRVFYTIDADSYGIIHIPKMLQNDPKAVIIIRSPGFSTPTRVNLVQYKREKTMT